MLSKLLQTAIGLSCSALVGCPPLQAAGPPEFAAQIRPLLAAHCFECHGPDSATRKAQLRLDQANLSNGSGLKDVVDTADSSRSKLLQRVLSTDPETRMPPPGRERLSGSEIEILQQWVRNGAVTGKHWAFVAPQPPEVPEVRDTSWPLNPIDNFILAPLERRNIRPSPPADRRTLLRRASLDIVGLPPALDQQQRFEGGQAWSELIRQLLESPHHGERLAQNWLDLARYADTSGHAADRPRTMWLYRDWVIDAFNRNMPFDEFTVEQLAGDMLPNPSDDQKIATGFHRNSIQALGNNPRKEEFRVKGIVDRLDTTGRTWLGLTIGCAECHDHKYDPVSQREYYELFAVFNNVPHEGERFDVHGPRIQVLPKNIRDRIRLLQKQVEILRVADVTPPPDESGFEEWCKQPQLMAAKQRGVFAMQVSGAVPRAIIRGRDNNLTSIETLVHRAGPARTIPSLKFDGETLLAIPNDDVPDIKASFSAAMWIRTESKVADLVGQYDWKSGKRSFVFGIGGQADPQSRAGRLSLWVSERPNPFRGVVAYGSIPIDDGMWHHVAVVVKAGRSVQFYVDGQLDGGAAVTGPVPETVAVPSLPLAIGAGFDNSNQPNGFHFEGELADLRLVDRPLSPRQLGFLTRQQRKAFDSGTASQLFTVYQEIVESLPDRNERIAELEREIEQLKAQRVTAQVMAELPEPRKTHIHRRGNFEDPGVEVTAGIPNVINVSVPDKVDRLSFAHSLVHSKHPLTARVAVNRLWAHYFGRGLVGTTDDFGVRGDLPSHPELLDWLALELISSDWNLRHIETLILGSAAYQQSSVRRPELIKSDPENRLIARMSRRRMAAEQIRDQALAAAGILSRKIGGASVFPPQPEGVGQFRDATAGVWNNSGGADQYRRSMYTFWQRMSPYPSMVIFDAPSRERCEAQRSRTNTPLQALVTLNDPHFVDIARQFADRIREHSDSKEQQIEFAFRCLLARSPTEREVRLFRQRLQQGEDLSQVDAWFLLAQVLLNLDETLTRE